MNGLNHPAAYADCKKNRFKIESCIIVTFKGWPRTGKENLKKIIPTSRKKCRKRLWTRSQRNKIFIMEEVVKKQYQIPVAKQNKGQKPPPNIDTLVNLIRKVSVNS